MAEGSMAPSRRGLTCRKAKDPKDQCGTAWTCVEGAAIAMQQWPTFWGAGPTSSAASALMAAASAKWWPWASAAAAYC